jgi:hypothetical protein
MEVFRAAAAFLAGVILMGAVHFTGWLDGLPHWWAHRHFLNSAEQVIDTSDHAHYSVRAVYQPALSDDRACPPLYEFHNHTNRQVAFSAHEGERPAHSGRPPNMQPQDYSDDDSAGPSDESARADDARYYNEYPGSASAQDEPRCKAGVVQIFMDRNR